MELQLKDMSYRFILLSPICVELIMQALLVAQVSFTQLVIAEEFKKRHWWLVGLLIVLLSVSVVLLLPTLRGYAI